MTRLRALVIVALIAGSFFACKSAKEQSVPSTIELRRTGCYGTCPIYKFTLDSKGKAQFEGERFTEKLGSWEKQFEEVELRPLWDLVKGQDWSQYEDEYPSNVSDLPATVLSIQVKKKVKTIYIEGEHPKSLDDVSAILIKLAESPGWENLNTQ